MDKQTIAAYNQTVAAYEEKTGHYWERFSRVFLDEFIRISGTKVIDVGSGPGRDGVLLREAGKEVVCIDASQAMVDACIAKGLHALVGDFTQLPAADGSYDAVWSYTALLHIPKASMGVALDEVYRVLRPGGIFALGMMEGNTEGYKEDGGMPRWFSYYTRDELEALCRQHGFQAVWFEATQPGVRGYLHFIFRKRA